MLSTSAYETADIELLLSVCRQELGTVHISDDKRLDDKEWRGLLAAARDHGLIGPLHKTAVKKYSASEESLRSIRTAYLGQAARNLQLVDALNDILYSFAEYAIEVIVLKGPAIALVAYGHITHREFTDLDLLVRPENFNKAWRLLNGLGYREVAGPSDKDVEFIRDCDQTFVELHWALNPPYSRFPLETTGMWDRLQTVFVSTKPIPTLNLEDTFITMCTHASRHRWESLKWNFDIAQVLTCKASVLNWEAMFQRCQTMGCTRAIVFGVQLANVLFEVSIPTVVAQMSKNTSVNRLVTVAKDALLQRRPPRQSDLLALHIHIHDRLWDRVFVAVTQPIPELPRLLPVVASPITTGPLRFLTRSARLLYLYGFGWIRTVFLSR